MTAETESLILEILKNIQGRLARMEADMQDLKLRQSAVEGHLGQQSVQIAALNARMDRFDERLARIERRLDLIDA
jgi:septal ring factor EnvC (AmiA/AmiB activator)